MLSPNLAETQRQLAAALDDLAAAVTLAPWITAVVGSPQRPSLSALERLAIYRDSSRRARERTLELIYPVCRQILGPRCFTRLAADYVDAFPSHQGDLNRYGEAFARHLAWVQERQSALADLVYLPDLARLEWHWQSVYYAPDEPPLDGAALARLAQSAQAEHARLRPSCSLRCLASAYPVAEIWRRHREGEDTASIAAGDGDRLVIHRGAGQPRVTAVTPAVFGLLSALMQGTTTAPKQDPTLGELAAAGHDLAPLPELIAAGWIAGVEPAGPS